MELTDEQLERRRGGLGGSDAPPVFDVGFRSRFSLWASKVWGTEIRSTPRMQRGHDLESLIAEKAAQKLGLTGLEPGGWVDHPEHPWMFSNLDWLASDALGRVVIECKAIEYRDKGHEWGADGDPDGCALHVHFQAMHQIETAELDIVYVAVLFVDTWELRVFPIRRNHDLQARLVEAEHHFWHDFVVPKIPPPVTDASTAWEALRQVRQRPDSAIDLPPAADELIEQYLTARAERLEMEKNEKALRAELAWLMQDNEHGMRHGEVAVQFRQPSTGEGSRRLVIPTPYQRNMIQHGNVD